MKTVKMKMTLLFGILMTITSFGLLATSLATSEKALVGDAQESMKALAVQAGKAIDAKLSNYLNALDALSYCGVFGDTKNADGHEQAVIKALKSEATRGGYLHMAYIDENGAALFDDGSSSDVKDTDYYQRAMNGESVVTEPALSDDGSLIMIYAVPVHSDGHILGVLMGIRDGFELGTLAGESANGKTGSAFIINKQGNTIAHSDKERMKAVLSSFSVSGSAAEEAVDLTSSATQKTASKDQAAADTESMGENLLGYANFGKLQQEMVEGQTGYGEYEYEGTGKILGFAPISGFGWSIGLEINRSEALSGINDLARNIIIIGGIFFVLALLIVYFASRKLSKPIEYLTGICYRMSTGDYSIEPEEKYKKRNDEMGRLAVAFHAIIDSTKALLKENTDISKQMAESSQKLDFMVQQFTAMMKEIASAVDQIAAGNMEQAEKTQLGAQQISDIEALIGQEEHNMLGLHASSNKVEQLKEEGFAILMDLVKKSEESGRLSEEIYQVFRDTNESAGRISDISAMIGGITKQTKLLALNASIEAARAGESGKGFSVVAKEVETLAEAADRLSKEIAGVVEDLSYKAEASIGKVDKITGAILQQTESVELTRTKFIGIAESINETRQNIDTLNQTIQDMNMKKNEVVRIIMDLSATSEENASGTEEVSVAVQEQTGYLDKVADLSGLLSDMAVQMEASSKKYKLEAVSE